MYALTNFDQRQCHKWAQLLLTRKEKLNQAHTAIKKGNYDFAKKIVTEIFSGFFGKKSDPGMAGSLLYHMAMVTKMEAETRVLLDELQLSLPDISLNLCKIYTDFEFDSKELTKEITPFSLNFKEIAESKYPGTNEKINLFSNLTKEKKALENLLSTKDDKASAALEQLFCQWTNEIIRMRLIQEFETIKGLLVTEYLAKNIGLSVLENAMAKVQEKFGEETVNIALDVTLKVGMRREKLQSVMLSDHFINYTMSTETLDGHMEFLNCPIYGSHKYAHEKYAVNSEVSTLFCKHFCFAHAKAMLNTVLPFPFTLWQPKLIAIDGNCEFYLKLAYSTLCPNMVKVLERKSIWQ